MTTVRVIGVVLQADVVLDDGKHLTPVAVNPVTILEADWENKAPGFISDIISQLQAQADKNDSNQ